MGRQKPASSDRSHKQPNNRASTNFWWYKDEPVKLVCMSTTFNWAIIQRDGQEPFIITTEMIGKYLR